VNRRIAWLGAAVLLIPAALAGFSAWEVRSAVGRGALDSMPYCLDRGDMALLKHGLLPSELRDELMAHLVAGANGWTKNGQWRLAFGLAVSRLGLRIGYAESDRARLGEGMLKRATPCKDPIGPLLHR